MHFSDWFSFLDRGERAWKGEDGNKRARDSWAVTPILDGCAVLFPSSGHGLYPGGLLKTRTDILPGARQGLVASVSSATCPLTGFTHQGLLHLITPAPVQTKPPGILPLKFQFKEGSLRCQHTEGVVCTAFSLTPA